MKRQTKPASIMLILLMSFPAVLWCHPDHWSDYNSGEDLGLNTMFSWSFDETPLGSLPRGWLIEGTNQQGPLAVWKIKTDKTRSSKALVLEDTQQGSGRTFNLCWTDKVNFLDGSINVKIKKGSGSIDQGGGIVWRVKDKDNYYVARWNPLEDNFRFYKVIDGVRKELASARVAVDPDKWHSVRIEQMGGQIKCFFNNELHIKLLDYSISEPGGVGLWTKADAATSFDNFEVNGWSTSETQKGDAP
ncbi:MAG: hypothetical protein GY780_07645 [bacterium]|nr:hypothetical protein [bacterium]